MSLNLNFSKMSVSTLIIEFISMFCVLLEYSSFYFFPALRLSFSYRFFTDDIDEMLVFDLLSE